MLKNFVSVVDLPISWRTCCLHSQQPTMRIITMQNCRCRRKICAIISLFNCRNDCVGSNL